MSPAANTSDPLPENGGQGLPDSDKLERYIERRETEIRGGAPLQRGRSFSLEELKRLAREPDAR